MLPSIEGIYRDGKVELLEPPPSDAPGRVIITFLTPQCAGLAQHGMDQRQALDLRQRLKAFAEDWDRPEMDVYDAS